MAKVKHGSSHLLYPQPAVLAGALVKGKPNYLAIAWCGIMQASPPIIYVSLRKERYTLPGIRENGTFSVNIPSTSQVAAVDFCGMNSGGKVDKSEIFTTVYGELKTAPMIEECPISMECRLIKEIDFGGTHIVFVGEIAGTYIDEASMTDGKPDIKKVDPLIYTTSGDYWGFGERIADAHSIGKTFRPGK
jgi:flavin reductase (DIM6/NTAB) family NADH-FMN oxidoreductase RutF